MVEVWVAVPLGLGADLREAAQSFSWAERQPEGEALAEAEAAARQMAAEPTELASEAVPSALGRAEAPTEPASAVALASAAVPTLPAVSRWSLPAPSAWCRDSPDAA